uniref:ODAD1 central coiled coil region domain-containing protein n=1 Tax=Pyrodinium bahamense TaxID=73915 RepID=A0A7S0AL36_9DINO|mmetsp:Transcript_36933/g.102590  ORF Transcript_36933/g.102590 Transcript_36933/m.102590 type:complete len:532 (+) Transcript_36933:66-1661(+)|eukprot:CAMPEP_0179077490 /NCGR_PEP_ID=MMETSP0796-20121207/34641_1 /TAXON_ID=73915 /ORGANISM="Pyrodinium bahamense, Strain pbaha01" /LENGTH=531 /DNA_ID=CAMNT_0020774771 /DNA_START=66 /DNA_END=1661 /DNA_ORIENTATION=-
MATKTAMSPEEQLDDLQRRFQLLEGERKATYETAKLNIQQNKEIIGQMKEENKTLRNSIAHLRNEKPQSTEKQLEKTMSDVQILQRKVDVLRAENTKKRATFDQLDKKVRELSSGAKMHSSEASPEMRQIRVLENRLDKAMIKYNEAQSIRKTYEAIVKRLKEERIGFDGQLAAIERTLKAKERDYEELLLLSHDAYHAKEMAQAELHRFEQGVMEERNQRDKEVQEKKVLVEQRVQMNKRLEQREKMLKSQQELDKQGERQKEMTYTSDLNAGISNDYAHEERQKLLDYEEAFHAIKEATGVSDPNEVIQKFLTQEDTQKNLQNLMKENQATIDRLTEDRRRLRLQVEELKFGSEGNVGRRQAIDDFETNLAEAQEKFDRNKGKFERMAKMLIDMKAGIDHLGEKLMPIRLDGEATIEVNDETVEEVLQQCELKISKLLSLTHHLEDPNDRKRMLDEERYEEKLMMKSQSDARIKLADKEEEADNDSEDFDEEMDEDVWHRKQVKYNSERILEEQQTKNRKKNKKAKKDG